MRSTLSTAVSLLLQVLATGKTAVGPLKKYFNVDSVPNSSSRKWLEETINTWTPAIIGRLYTETKPLKGRWSPPYLATENGA